MLKQMFFIVFLLGFLSVYAQEDDLIVLEDDDRSETDIEKLLDADQNEKIVEVNDNNDRVVKDLFVESEVYDTVKVKNMSPFSETNMHWGGSVHLGGASLNGLYGPKGRWVLPLAISFIRKWLFSAGLIFMRWYCVISKIRTKLYIQNSAYMTKNGKKEFQKQRFPITQLYLWDFLCH